MDIPVITALITAGGAITAALVNTLLKKKDKPAEKKPEIVLPDKNTLTATPPAVVREETEVPIPPLPAPLPPQPLTRKPVPRKEFPLTHSQIDKSISDAALFHRDDIAKGFIGMRVCWLGKLTHLRRIAQQTMQVSFMLVEDDSSLFCTVHSDSISVLIPLREGAVVEICGRIKSAALQTTVLEDCEFSVVSEIPFP